MLYNVNTKFKNVKLYMINTPSNVYILNLIVFINIYVYTLQYKTLQAFYNESESIICKINLGPAVFRIPGPLARVSRFHVIGRHWIRHNVQLFKS